MEVEELKLRQLWNQHLMEKVDCLTAVRDLCGIQAQFLSNGLHALSIRSDSVDTQDLVKSWTLRGTMHLFAREDLPLFLHEGRSHFLRPCDTLEGDDRVTRERKRYFAELIVESVASGVGNREALKALCAERGMTDSECESIFNAWGGTVRALCENGKLCYKVQEKKEFCLCPPFTPMDCGAAQLELARRYFTHYGPATLKDAAYFFAVTQAKVKKWLAQLPVTVLVWGGKEYFVLESPSVSGRDIPECLYLAGFDPLMLGYQKSESLYLPGEHLRGIFTLAGIVMPAVLLRGRVVGKWKQKNGNLLVTLFEAVSAEDRNRMEQTARSLWENLKSIRIE